MEPSFVQILRGSGGNDPALAARALGVLMSCGGALVVLALLVAPPPEAKTAGLLVTGSIAFAVGTAGILWATRARTWMVHAAFAGGTGLICLGVYFADLAAGAYSVLLIWMAVIGASFFSPRALAAHLAWIVVASGVVITRVDGSAEVSAPARWVVGSLLLIVAGAVMSQIVAGRRAAEEKLREEIGERKRLQRELEHQAHHDFLTGLPNRRRLGQELAREVARAERQGAPLSVAVLDLDDFKAYNDSHGHAAGDRLLKRAASSWADTLRATDLLARIGGDEFVAVLPDCAPAEAARVIARFRERYPRGHSFSAGVASWQPYESVDELLARADLEMYRAKESARRTDGPARATLGTDRG